MLTFGKIRELKYRNIPSYFESGDLIVLQVIIDNNF